MPPLTELLLLLACAQPDPSSVADSAEAEPTWPQEIDCAQEPAVSWEGWAQGKIATHCQGCHGSGSPNRYGAPEEVVFDTLDQVASWKERIHERTIVVQDMPPAGGLTDDELALFEIFLACTLP